MYILLKQRLLPLSFSWFLVFSLSAFMLPAMLSLNIIQRVLPTRSLISKNISHLHIPIPTTQTNCPSPTRAAVRISPRTNNRQNLIYTYNTSNNGFLIRYDIKSREKITLLRLNNATISNAQLSTDRHFILFVTQVSSHLAIQMIRSDGQDLQTLYCAPNSKGPINFIDDLLWSPNQQQIIFRVPDSNSNKMRPIIHLLDLAHGSLQTLLVPANDTGYIPRIWPTTNQIYMQGYSLEHSDSIPPHDVYVLDIPNKSVRPVASVKGYDWDLSLTPDGKELLLAQAAALPPLGQPQPPSVISEQAAYGGVLHLLYASHVYAVTQVRAISAKTLLFVLGGRFASGTLDGLWKINMDGNDLTHLTKDGKLLSDQSTIQALISDDGGLYAVASYHSTSNPGQGQTTLLYGSLSGGGTTLVDTSDVSDNASIVGWTTI